MVSKFIGSILLLWMSGLRDNQMSTSLPYINTLYYGARGGTRTHKIRLLRPTRIPIPSPGHKFQIVIEQCSNCFVCIVLCSFSIIRNIIISVNWQLTLFVTLVLLTSYATLFHKYSNFAVYGLLLFCGIFTTSYYFANW